jgi:hypothetical protein
MGAGCDPASLDEPWGRLGLASVWWGGLPIRGLAGRPVDATCTEVLNE